MQQIGISDTCLEKAEPRFLEWLERGWHGEMQYLQRHGEKRARPQLLLPFTRSIIVARMDYLPIDVSSNQRLNDSQCGYIANYALGRDYHKVLRRRLQKLASCIAEEVGGFQYRAFVDSAPVLEKPLAEKAGLGWIGKNTNLISKQGGAWFFIGVLFTDLTLPSSKPSASHCGSCRRCLDCCPTNALVEPWQLDARRCISYLTIESKSSIPIAMRPLIGNRIFGCDDCLSICPWNRFAKVTTEPDFLPRDEFNAPKLLEIFAWSDADFRKVTEGSPLRRLGHERWLRNIAVAMGNVNSNYGDIKEALRTRLCHPSLLVQEHVNWALRQISNKSFGC